MGYRDGVVGFRRARSHTLCEIDACIVLAPGLQRALAGLQAKPPSGKGELTLSGGDDGNVSIAGAGRRGAPIELRHRGDAIRVSSGGFFQANGLLRGGLADAVHEAAGRGTCAIELFAGAGFFTPGLARRFDHVVAIESHGTATRDLRTNLEAAGLDNVEVATARAETRLESPALAALGADVVVLDPPRTGLPRGSATRIADLAAKRIVYVSCDPGTLARDLKALTGEGYALASLRAYDLFPQTPHLEAIAVLGRT